MPSFFDKYPYTDFHELNLDWIIKTVKETVAEWAVTLTEWHNTQEEWQSLYTYVHDFFDNLDVQAEVNIKIDEMVTDGTMAAIAQPYIEAKVADLLPAEVSAQIGGTVADQIDNVVSDQINSVVASQIQGAIATPVAEWLDDHITQPTTPVVDTSLTIPGAAADAKVTGDDIRLLSEYIDDITGPGRNLINPLTITEGFYLNNADGSLVANATYCVTDYIEVKENTYHFGAGLFTCCFYDSNKVFISGVGATNGKRLTPSGASYIRISVLLTNLPTALYQNADNIITTFEPYEKRISAEALDKVTYNAIDRILAVTETGKNKFDPGNVYADMYVANDGSIASNSGWTLSNYIDITGFTSGHVSVRGASGIYGAFYDVNYNYIASSWFSGTISARAIPSGAAYLLVSISTANVNSLQVADSGTPGISFEPFGYVVKDNKGEAVMYSGVGFNKIDPDRLSPGYYIVPSDGSAAANATFTATDFIDISGFTKGVSIITSGTMYYSFYDASYAYISGNGANSSRVLTIPAGAVYFRASFLTSVAGNVMICDSDKVEGYDAPAVVTDKKIAKECISDYLEPVTVHVIQDGTGDFTTLNDAFDYVMSLPGYNTRGVTVYVHEGTYDIFNDIGGHDYIVANWAKYGNGLIIPAGCTVRGYGNRADIVLQGYCDSTYSDAEKTALSPLFIGPDDAVLDNLTITAQNCRYVIHEDSAAGYETYKHVIKNCTLEYISMDVAGWYGGCIGAGCHSNADITVDNCTLIGRGVANPIGYHSNTSFNLPAHIRILNCDIKAPNYNPVTKIPYISFRSINSGVLNTVEYTGNKQECPINLRVTSPSDVYDFEIYGHGNTPVTILNNTGQTVNTRII